MKGQITAAWTYNQVAGNDTCDRYWIPLKKNLDGFWYRDTEDQRGRRETFLPFAQGEPNGENLQNCAAVMLGREETSYFDQDCKQNFACSVCMIPLTRIFTLRGIGKDSLIDDVYILNTYVLDTWKCLLGHHVSRTGIILQVCNSVFQQMMCDNILFALGCISGLPCLRFTF